MAPMTNTGSVHADIEQLIDELPERYTVVHSNYVCTIWTDGEHHGGACMGIPDMYLIDQIARTHSLELSVVWNHQPDDGVHILTFIDIEGSGPQ